MPIRNKKEQRRQRRERVTQVETFQSTRHDESSSGGNDTEDEETRGYSRRQDVSREFDLTLEAWKQYLMKPRVLIGNGLWLTVFGIALKYGFGMVFVVSSVLAYFFHFCMSPSGDNSQDHEVPSAYSVFNKNQQKILGDADSKTLERSLRSGGMH